jgi:uncharacterized protein (TIGR00369 family)
VSIWKRRFTPEQLNQQVATRGNDMFSHVGIEFVDVGEDYLSARMPVDHRTRQPMGILHGGASVVLAETLGSMAAVMSSDPEGGPWFGLEVNANHLRAVRDGHVTATARPVHTGRSTSVWDIRLVDDAGRMTCICRLTMIRMPADSPSMAALRRAEDDS